MAASLSVRAAIESDIPAIAGLLDQLNAVEGYAVVTDVATLHDALFAPSREVKLAALVAELIGKVEGVLLYYPGYDTLSASVGYHLADMVVAASAQRQGVGKMLVKTLAAEALGDNKEWISLTALKRNHAAKSFYTSLGMSEVEVDFFAMGKNTLARL